MRLSLCEAPTRETRLDHNTGNYVPYKTKKKIPGCVANLHDHCECQEHTSSSTVENRKSHREDRNGQKKQASNTPDEDQLKELTLWIRWRPRVLTNTLAIERELERET